MESFGKRLKEIRKKRHITQEDLGKAIGVSKPEICFYENGYRNPSLNSLVEIADFLEVDIAWLLGRELKTSKQDDRVISLSIEELSILKYIRENKELSKKILEEIK